ncbi:MAG: glycosyltransferase family 2 protein [Candidatus Bathyarchaeota archaeon]|nr:glycosyltransferase family 2 protein [Candidatus Bathyarchaeota archaeon]
MEKDGSPLSVLVIVATLNEEEGIGPTLAELRDVLEDPMFLVVDGNSTDRTVEVAKEMGAEVLFQKGTGKGDAIAHAIKHVDSSVKYVVFIDADYTYPAEYLAEMMRILEENPHVGMVCGNRFNAHFHLEAMHNVLYTGNRMLAFVHNMLNGVQMRDPLTGLRVVRWEILKDWKPKSKSFDLEVELNHYVERRGHGIVEIPIYYRSRLGEKKLKIKHGFTILKRILLESIY